MNSLQKRAVHELKTNDGWLRELTDKEVFDVYHGSNVLAINVAGLAVRDLMNELKKQLDFDVNKLRDLLRSFGYKSSPNIEYKIMIKRPELILIDDPFSDKNKNIKSFIYNPVTNAEKTVRWFYRGYRHHLETLWRL